MVSMTVLLSLALSVPTMFASTMPLPEDGMVAQEVVWVVESRTRSVEVVETKTVNGATKLPPLVIGVPVSSMAPLPTPPMSPIIVIPEVVPSPSPSPSPTPTPTPSTSTPSSSQQPPSSASWTAPAHFTDLTCFGIQKWATGKNNLKLVNGIPASASHSVSLPGTTSPAAIAVVVSNPIVEPSLPTWDNTTTAIQLLYPAHSSNPGGSPVGGAEIYFLPPDLGAGFRKANKVTLEYSVFFPLDFDWVKGGKLPGLYGGHMGCSGGNDAANCFSTRMMWRTAGAGELYLYAPQKLQVPSLCEDPRSVCDSSYGLSIGRGAFSFAAGGWTHIRQTVGLNTPSVQDGTFELEVDGKMILNLTQIVYRQIVGAGVAERRGLLDGLGGAGDGEDPLGGLLPPLLGGVDSILGDLGSTSVGSTDSTPTSTTNPTTTTTVIATADSSSRTSSKAPNPSSTKPPSASPTAPITFSGVFFSTFFGGHGSDWESPRDQYTWFKDFALRIHS